MAGAQRPQLRPPLPHRRLHLRQQLPAAPQPVIGCCACASARSLACGPAGSGSLTQQPAVAGVQLRNLRTEFCCNRLDWRWVLLLRRRLLLHRRVLHVQQIFIEAALHRCTLPSYHLRRADADSRCWAVQLLPFLHCLAADSDCKLLNHSKRGRRCPVLGSIVGMVLF